MFNNKFKEALLSGEFAVTCEMIPGRGAWEASQDKAFEDALEIYRTGRVHAISVTDNPGGNPAILADGVGRRLQEQGVCSLVHFTCKDRNRNQVMSQLYDMEREGVENLLFMTGDFEGSGWKGLSRPSFDLDSVQIQLLAQEMNEGLEVTTPRGMVVEKPTHFFNGAVVNPFKYREGEAIPQYLKLEKKIVAGAQFLISQVGYDVRKMQELLMYLNERGYGIPVLANIFVLTRGTAALMKKGAIAGCHVSDELMATLEEESAREDKGRPQRVERAAQLTAIAKGLGYAGVHIGGFGVDAAMVNQILDRAQEIGEDWRAHVEKASFPEKGGYYLYAPERDERRVPTGLNTSKHANMGEDISGRNLFKNDGISRFAHYWGLTLDERLNKVLAASMDRRDKKKGTLRPHGIEHAGKALMYGCQDCGDCGLEATGYSCPMTQCPKCQRNGPCGGSDDGWCEVHPGEKYCIWYMAYHRAKKHNELDKLKSYITPPNDWGHFGSSAWSNYTHRRDNIAHRIPVSLGFGGAPGGIEEDKQ